MSSIVKHGIKGLLADILKLTGVSLDAPDDLGMAWALKEGPQLDKQLLAYLERKGEIPLWPEWLLPLWHYFAINDSGAALKVLRQLLVFGYKLEIEPTNEQIQEAQASFEEVDSSIELWNMSLKDMPHDPVLRTARSIIGRVIANIDWKAIVPSHGPGAVYPSCCPSEKGNMTTIYADLDALYPYYDYLHAIPGFWPSASEAMNSADISEATYTYTKLVAVPKDSRGPRIICVHPKELIWIQQGQRKLLERAIAKSAAGPYIKFKDQSVNGALALASSATREYCTLDLKDASDRLSLNLLRYLFGDAARWLEASRAQIVEMFDGRFMKLRKFAPMGNCLTFPVQSLVFWALVQSGIRNRYGEDCNAKTYVFGDDILFPSVYYDGAVNALTRAGFVTNTNKTFIRGFFRESCGVDAYHGIDVTPHRLKHWDVTSVSNLVSLCALAKNLRLDGYEETSAVIYNHVRDVHPLLVLTNNKDTQGICEYVDRDLSYIIRNNPRNVQRYNRGLQRYEVKVPLVVGTSIVLTTHGRYHVQDSLVRLTLPSISPNRKCKADSWFVREDEARRGARQETGGASISREFEYPLPFGERVQWGWTPVITTGEDVCLTELVYRLLRR